MMPKFFRKKLSMPGLLQELKSFFQTLKEPVIRKGAIPLVDGLLSGLAIFSLKYPSLLQFDKSRQETTSAHNLKTLVLDNARYQKCRLVQELALSLKIELLYIPPYSPNFNLIERLFPF